ncbi:VPS28 (YPL065W) [Zygosaccharomyces parabailii]|nr:VPS28 (YPL065W) [Zygosaccharomyces parabailii]CDH14156.1 related to Vacuolar protein sorting-associated protein 28 [Zygosaccharomyces bailii ISA1307]
MEEEIPLFDASASMRQREIAETLAEVYSIILCVDQVEKMYIKDVVSDESEYTRVTSRLLQQYRAIIVNNEHDQDFQKAFGGSLSEFCRRYGVIASNGVLRLEKGIPLTTEHAATGSLVPPTDSTETDPNASPRPGEGMARGVAEATGNFITVMDAVKLGYRNRSQLHPLLAELLLSTNRVARLDSRNRGRLVEWLVRLNRLRSQETLDEKAARELLADLDAAYREFYSALG